MSNEAHDDHLLQKFRPEEDVASEVPVVSASAQTNGEDSAKPYEDQTLAPPHSPSTHCSDKDNPVPATATPPPPPPPPTEVGSEKSDVAAAPRSERRNRRKPLHPQKSLSLLDPNFRGVTLCFHTVVHGGESELIITPIYSKNLARLQRRRRRQHFSSESEQDGGHSTPEETLASNEEHSRVRPTTFSSGAVKCCASCATRRTPLWRDAEDGTPLCNACGIRYRKYRLRCGSCWHIPRKDNKLFPACSQCGGALRFSQARKC